MVGTAVGAMVRTAVIAMVGSTISAMVGLDLVGLEVGMLGRAEGHALLICPT